MFPSLIIIIKGAEETRNGNQEFKAQFWFKKQVNNKHKRDEESRAGNESDSRDWSPSISK